MHHPIKQPTYLVNSLSIQYIEYSWKIFLLQQRDSFGEIIDRIPFRLMKAYFKNVTKTNDSEQCRISRSFAGLTAT